MEDNKSLLSVKTGSACSFKSLWKRKDMIIPLLGLLVFLICLLFIFSVLLGSDVSCDNDWTMFNQSCYKVVRGYNDIEVCREDCKRQGGDLASIHSMEENDFIVSFHQDNPIWTGGSITEKDGQFRWLDGSDWDFENWDEGEPDKKKFGKTHHECVFVGDNPNNLGLWWDGVCKWSYRKYDCVCKKG
eukprot:GFUD01020695.1.p1 GENE.GFUD01020695.1~~GFUD01020695.1.p1  ORF type:complete len:187 (+),score=32.94 GFUD01020695.1:219-779(+)